MKRKQQSYVIGVQDNTTIKIEPQVSSASISFQAPDGFSSTDKRARFSTISDPTTVENDENSNKPALPTSLQPGKHSLKTLSFTPATVSSGTKESASFLPDFNQITCHVSGRLICYVTELLDSSEHQTYLLRLAFLNEHPDLTPDLQVFAYHVLKGPVSQVALVEAVVPHILVLRVTGEISVLRAIPNGSDSPPSSPKELETIAAKAIESNTPIKMLTVVQLEFDQSVLPSAICWHPNPGWSFVSFHKDWCAVWSISELAHSSKVKVLHRIRNESDVNEKGGTVYPFSIPRRVAKSVEIYSSSGNLAANASAQKGTSSRIVIAKREDHVSSTSLATTTASSSEQPYVMVDYSLQLYNEDIFLFILFLPNLVAVYHDTTDKDDAALIFKGVFTIPDSADFKKWGVPSSIRVFPFTRVSTPDREYLRLTHAASIGKKTRFKLSAHVLQMYQQSKMCIGFNNNTSFVFLEILMRSHSETSSYSQYPSYTGLSWNEWDRFFVLPDPVASINLMLPEEHRYVTVPTAYEDGLICTVTQGLHCDALSHNPELHSLLESLCATHHVSAFSAYWTYALHIDFTSDLTIVAKLVDPFLRNIQPFPRKKDSPMSSTPFFGVAYRMAYKTEVAQMVSTYASAIRFSSENEADTERPAQLVALLPHIHQDDYPVLMQYYSALNWHSFVTDTVISEPKEQRDIGVMHGQDTMESPLLETTASPLSNVPAPPPTSIVTQPVEARDGVMTPPEGYENMRDAIPTPPGFSSPSKPFAAWDNGHQNAVVRPVAAANEPSPIEQPGVNETLAKLAEAIAVETREGLREEMRHIISQSLVQSGNSNQNNQSSLESAMKAMDGKLSSVVTTKTFKDETNSLVNRLEHAIQQTFSHSMSTLSQSFANSMKTLLAPFVTSVIEESLTKQQDELLSRVTDVVRTTIEETEPSAAPETSLMENNKELVEYMENLKERLKDSILMGHARQVATLQHETISRVNTSTASKFERVEEKIDALSSVMEEMKADMLEAVQSSRSNISKIKHQIDLLSSDVSSVKESLKKDQQHTSDANSQLLPTSIITALDKLASEMAVLRASVESVQASHRDSRHGVDALALLPHKHLSETLYENAIYGAASHPSLPPYHLRRHRHEIDHEFRMYRPHSCNECLPLPGEVELYDGYAGWANNPPTSEYGGSQRRSQRCNRHPPHYLPQHIEYRPNLDPQSMEIPSSNENPAVQRKIQPSTETKLTTPVSKLRLADVAKGDDAHPSTAFAQELLKLSSNKPGAALYKAIRRDKEGNLKGFWTLMISREVTPRTLAVTFKTPLVLGAANLLAESITQLELDPTREIADASLEISYCYNQKTEVIPMKLVLHDPEDVINRLRWIQRALVHTPRGGLLSDEEIQSLKQLIYNRICLADSNMVHPRIVNDKVYRNFVDIILEMCS